MTQQRLKTQVLVIGAGISGSTSALTLADAGYEVTLIVPGKELDGGNSALAQGGIVYRSDPNDAKDLEKDILIAGHHHNYVKAVRHLCQHGPEAVERILMERAPIPFDRLDGKLDFTREPRPPAKVPKYVLSGKGCGISKTTRMLAQKQP